MGAEGVEGAVRGGIFSTGRRALAVGILVAASAVAAQGQSAAAAGSARSSASAPRWSFGGWVGGATGQPLETRYEGHVHDRDLFITALRAMHPLTASRRFRLQSTVDLFPLVVATANRDYTVENVIPVCEGPLFCTGNQAEVITSRPTAYAFGIAPLGFEGIVALSPRIGLSAGVEGGALYFNRRIPDPGETRFNFMADASVALRFSLGASRPTLIGGFQLNHISNGGTGRVNPGMDSHLLFVGLEQ